jgi:hypothetical protein
MKIKKNGKVVKLTESDLQKIVKRVLEEQIESIGIPDNTNPDNSPNINKPNGGGQSNMITIGIDGREMKINARNALATGSVFLSAIAGILITNGIQKMISSKDVKRISREIDSHLEGNLSKDDIKCLKRELSKFGKVENLNNERNGKKVRSRIGSCLANSDSGMTVDEFFNELVKIIDKYDYSKQFKKNLNKRNRKNS